MPTLTGKPLQKVKRSLLTWFTFLKKHRYATMVASSIELYW